MLDLGSSPAIDVAVGMAFIYFLLSLLASTVQEGIAGLFKLRAKMLEKGLREMLANDSTAPGTSGEQQASPEVDDLVSKLYRHPLIASQTKGNRPPSYISPRTFALALLDTLAPDAQAQGNRDAVAAAKTEVEAMSLPGGVRHWLLTQLNAAAGDVRTLRHSFEAWFDDSMARVSGWYKRKSQWIVLCIGIVATVALNANTLTIAEQLWKDPTVRAAVVAQAESGTASEGTPGKTAREKLENAAKNVSSVREVGIPLGWTQNSEDPRHFDPGSVKSWVRTVGGWTLTVFAIFLGAPFWFDSLSRLSRLRSSGKPEQPLPASGRGLPGERIA